MDAFYASVEQRDNPDLRGKPVAVGGSRERGVVAAASYEARKFGVHSAMPSITAKRKCPDLIFVKPRFDAYKAISLQIREIFAEYTPIIEPLSLDEAYLDVTENLKGIALATQLAEEIRAKIRAETGLTASAGVSYNKFLAKLASDHRKPDGLFVITPKMGPAFVETLPVRKFHGVGPATGDRSGRYGAGSGRPNRRWLGSRAYLPEMLEAKWREMVLDPAIGRGDRGVLGYLRRNSRQAQLGSTEYQLDKVRALDLRPSSEVLAVWQRSSLRPR